LDSPIDFKPPKAVAAAAEKGLEYRRRQGKDKAGLTPGEASKEGIGSGVQRATNLKNRDKISPKVIRQMVAFFSRHAKNKAIDAKHKDEPWKDKGYVSWLLWGGDPGKAWAEKVLKQMEAGAKRVADLLNRPHKLFDPRRAEREAEKLRRGDPDWEYRVVHDPKGTGKSFIEVYDEEGHSVGRVASRWRAAHSMPSRVASRYLRAKAKDLRIFDFDDTLATGPSSVKVEKANGEMLSLSSTAFAHYEPTEGDTLDFGGFNDVVSPRIIKEHFDRLRESVESGARVAILTARPKGAASAISAFLESQGIEGVEVAALQSSDPYDKARWVDRALESGGHTTVEYYDDHAGNVRAVEEHLAKHKGVKSKCVHASHPEESDYAGPPVKRSFKSTEPTTAQVKYEAEGGGKKKDKDKKEKKGPSSWWESQTPTFQKHYCEEHTQSQYCKGASMDTKQAGASYVKQKIKQRARRASPKVRGYVQSFLQKIDQAGPSAGIFLEDLESNFDDLKKSKKGLLRKFSDKDLDSLREVLFG